MRKHIRICTIFLILAVPLNALAAQLPSVAQSSKLSPGDSQIFGRALGMVKLVVGKSQSICIQSPGIGQIIFTFNKNTKFNGLVSYKDIQPNQRIAVDFTRSGDTYTATAVSLMLAKLPEGVASVSTDEMKELLTKLNPDSGIIVYDTRPALLFHKAHIPGAISLPSSEDINDPALLRIASALPKDKNRQLVFYCGGSTRSFSSNAAAMALKNGYKNVKVYYDGFIGWQKAEIPFATSPAFVKNENVLLLDLRPAKAYEEAHIPGAFNAPLEKFKSIPEKNFPDYKDAPIVLYGGSTAEINEAMEQMRDFNFANATFLPGGIASWKKAGYQTEKGSRALPAKLVYLRKLTPAEVSLSDFRKAVGNKNQMIIDARTKDEFALGSVDGAVNISFDETARNLSRIPKDMPVYLYCANGSRSEIAYQYLKTKGYTNVKWLRANFNFTDGKYTLDD